MVGSGGGRAAPASRRRGRRTPPRPRPPLGWPAPRSLIDLVTDSTGTEDAAASAGGRDEDGAGRRVELAGGAALFARPRAGRLLATERHVEVDAGGGLVDPDEARVELTHERQGAVEVARIDGPWTARSGRRGRSRPPLVRRSLPAAHRPGR